jgi:UDP-glucose 4-epimerase
MPAGTDRAATTGADTPTGGHHVLVTGGAGFIGSHLCALLASQGRSVTVLDNLSTGRETNLAGVRHRLIRADIRDGHRVLDEAGPFDEIYHLAAAVGVGLVLDDPVGSIETNVGGTAAVLRHAADRGTPVLLASSSEVYGKPGASVFSEDDDTLYGPTTVTRWSYAASKALDEHLALAYHRTRGLRTVAVRFFNTVGPRQVGTYGMVLPRFVRAALAGEPLRVFGDGAQSRCFTDVRDAVRALPALLATQTSAGRVFNLGSDRPITIRELAETVVRTLGSRSRLEFVPYDEAYPAGFEDLRHRRPDLTRIRAAVGFEPTIGLEQTILDVAGELRREQHSPAGERSR